MRGVLCVVAYNRVDSLIRLMRQIDEVNLSKHSIDFVVSVDYSDLQDELVEKLKTCSFKNHYELLRHNSNLGLKRHVLKCGAFVENDEYDYVIVLEDDLCISIQFIEFVNKAVSFIDCQDSVAAISLYSYQIEENTLLPFRRVPDGFDAYYMQFPPSWGQIWSKRSWRLFSGWLKKNDCDNFFDHRIPKYICDWPICSWKKHFARFLVDAGMYVLYPNYSLTTNPGVNGTNQNSAGLLFDTPLLRESINWRLPLLNDVSVKYNMSFSSSDVEKVYNLTKYEVAKLRYKMTPIGVRAVFLLLVASLVARFKDS